MLGFAQTFKGYSVLQEVWQQLLGDKQGSAKEEPDGAMGAHLLKLTRLYLGGRILQALNLPPPNTAVHQDLD